MATYALVAIVRDEADSIRRLVVSTKAVVSTATVVDTGSEDDTVGILLSEGVHAVSRPWVNFGHNRSEALALARGTADWLLTLDADMTVEIDPDFEPNPAVDCYMIRMGDDPDFAYRLPLLLRGDLPWESRGAVHEYTTLPDRSYIGVPTDAVRVHLHGDRSSREKSVRYALMLEEELWRKPDDPRTVFYLANTYWDLRDSRAELMYERRIRLGDTVEEVFYSMHRHALLQTEWPDKMQELIAAWEFRPHRLEPAYELAHGLNYRGQHHAAYRFASVPLDPTPDSVFVHQLVWRWGMDFERSIAAWHVGRVDESRELCDRLLGMDGIPDNVRETVQRNRSFC